jgi:hypothetical protein
LALTGPAITIHGIIAIVSQSYLRAWRDGWEADLEALPGRVQRASLRLCECGLVMTKVRFSHLHCHRAFRPGEDGFVYKDLECASRLQGWQ